MGGFYLSLAILWGILIVVGFAVLGPRYSHLLRLIREPLMIAFSTASSEAAYPKTLEGLNRFGASSRISAFVLPLGYSFNLDGTNIYMTLTTLFIAQALNVPLSFGEQMTILIVAMLTSKGASGVTGAGFITLAATLASVRPELVPGMAIVLGIDKFMSECRALTNITGNGLAAIVVAWWEGELDRRKLEAGLNRQIDPSSLSTAVTTG
jgi:aerobic C4-dicarboxylate transport protein